MVSENLHRKYLAEPFFDSSITLTSALIVSEALGAHDAGIFAVSGASTHTQDTLALKCNGTYSSEHVPKRPCSSSVTPVWKAVPSKDIDCR